LAGRLNSEAWPNPLPDLYDGQPIVVTVKADDAERFTRALGNLGGLPWRTTLDLSKARPARGIEKLWARNKIAALDESRVRGFDGAYIDSQVLDVALAHHLTSRLPAWLPWTWRPAVLSRTPDKRAGADQPPGRLGRRCVPRRNPASMASSTPPFRRCRRHQLALAKAPEAAVAPEDAGVVLPQTATDSRLLFALGLLFVIAGGLMLRRRIASEGTVEQARPAPRRRRRHPPHGGRGLSFRRALHSRKAAVAQVLLERALGQAEAGDPAPKPWPWADIAPSCEARCASPAPAHYRP
jgi:LPXTG-motif cell wall-anchored protein